MKKANQKRFRVVTLGCRTNQYESQAYKDQLIHAGYEAALEGEPADLCLVNTCTVTASADARSRHAIRALERENPGAEIVVTGCSVEQQPEVIKAIPGVSRLVRNKDKENLLQDLYPEEEFPEFSIRRFDAHTRAFVKVQDGCNSFCTYCLIPYVRGRSRSRKMDEILKEVKELVSNGYREIVLTGINVGDFDGGGENVTLAELVRQVDQVPGVERLRISSIDPDEVDDDLLDAVVNGKHTSPSMHIVLQAGSNVVLKRMNRKYTRQLFYDTVERLRLAEPDFTFTTDVIVGFPGETENDFQETLEVVQKVRFAKVDMFPYSDRERTRANLYQNKVLKSIISDRKAKLMYEAEKTAYRLREEYVGRKMMILTEAVDKEGSHGHTDNFLQVTLPNERIGANQMIEVELIENTASGLIGRKIK